MTKWGWNKPPKQFGKPKIYNDPKVSTVKAIAALLKEGKSSVEIADELGIKPSTVRTYIHDYQLR